MAKVNPTLQYSLFSWDSLDEFAHLDDLREVIEIMPNDKLVAILKRRCKDGCKDWPVEAMLNAFYAMLVLKYRSIECLRRNLANNPTLMRVCGFPPIPGRDDYMQVPSKSMFSSFFQLLLQEQDAVMELPYSNRERLMELCPNFEANLGFDGKKLHSYLTG